MRAIGVITFLHELVILTKFYSKSIKKFHLNHVAMRNTYFVNYKLKGLNSKTVVLSKSQKNVFTELVSFMS